MIAIAQDLQTYNTPAEITIESVQLLPKYLAILYIQMDPLGKMRILPTMVISGFE